MTVELIEGDCLLVMRELPDNSIDAIVTDPPYGLSFMGRQWDYDVPTTEVWAECLRVLKPGGHLLSFFGTRTYHRGVVRIEDAGFEIRDQIMWLYGSGFPKSSNQDGDWEGWGTALKPAHEPIVMARKPLIGTVPANLAAHGVGALNIDRCRVGDDIVGWGGARGGSDDPTQSQGRNFRLGEGDARPAVGRWPANVIHDGSDEVLAAFPDARGQIADASSSSDERKTQHTYGQMRRGNDGAKARDTGGSAARFFYCAKASKSDRDDGLGDFRAKSDAAHRRTNLEETADSPYLRGVTERKNTHPTVKPTDLMRYLCRLVTPPGGTVLDPFMGSGSTGRGAVLEGFNFIGVEMDAGYFDIADARIAAAELRVAEKMQAAE